jgi:hypothetical protein
MAVLPTAVRSRNMRGRRGSGRATVKKTAYHRLFAIAARDGRDGRSRVAEPAKRDFFDTVGRANGYRHAKNADFKRFDALSSFQATRFAS